MKPLNARTWHRLGAGFFLIIPAIALGILLPEDSPFRILPPLLFAYVIVLCLWGAWMGIQLARGRVRMGCPLCREVGEVPWGDANGMRLDCPQCGELRLALHNPFRLRVVRVGSEEDELAQCAPASGNGLTHPASYPRSFALIFVPVILSIVVGSVLHGFSLFFLLIPGFFCYCVGGFLVEAFHQGRLTEMAARPCVRSIPCAIGCT